MKKKFRWLDLIMFFVLLLGFASLAYPFVSDALNNYLNQQLITHYQAKATKQNEKAAKKMQAEMDQKNKELAKTGGNPGADPFSEEAATAKKDNRDRDYYEEKTLGIVHIPKIKQTMPIFDGTAPLFLEKGAGLLEGTSYPTGGESTHAVITAHRGLPEAKLFTDLPKLVNGDQFFIEINGETLAYEIYATEVVEPTETASLLIQPTKDLVTLLTCTPYMVNSHRLLVTGKRVPFEPEKDAALLKQGSFWQKYGIYFWVVGSILLLLGIVSLFYWLKHRKNKKFSAN